MRGVGVWLQPRQRHGISWRRGAAGVWAVALGILMTMSACDGASAPTCTAGELRYRGRPPARLFLYDESCRSDCFSAAGGDCTRDCGEVVVGGSPVGELRSYWDEPSKAIHDAQVLTLVDPNSLGAGRALVFEFGFERVENGLLGQGASWGGFMQEARAYGSAEVQANSTFSIRAAVVTEPTRGAGIEVAALDGRLLTGPLPATPGRLEIDAIAAQTDRLRGRFYLSFETPTAQPQGMVVGCFDLAVGAESSTREGYRPLSR